MIRVLIVDDEPLARDTSRLVLDEDPEVEIVGDCTGTEAESAILVHRPDLVFLDVQMPEVDGFDVIAAIGVEAMPAVVFVTAYDQHAIRAFEVHAVDYVLKPFDDRRLLAALDRTKQRLASAATSSSSPRATTSSTARASNIGLSAVLEERERARPILHRFVVRDREKLTIVDARTVDCLQAADDYVELHVGNVVHIVRERLSDLEARLDPARFVRIHRSTIVNLDRVRELHPLVRGDALVVLEGGAAFRASRNRRDELVERLTVSPSTSDRSPQRR